MTCPRSHSSRVREPRYEARRPGSRAWNIRPYVLPLHTYSFRRGEATVEELGEARGGSHEGRLSRGWRERQCQSTARWGGTSSRAWRDGVGTGSNGKPLEGASTGPCDWA